MRVLGYPKGRETLCSWIDELAPGKRKKRGPNLSVSIKKSTLGYQIQMR